MNEKFDPFDHDEVEPENINTEKVKLLNDQFRTTFEGGRIVCTQGIAGLQDDTRLKIFSAIQTFNNFTPENDPYGEHDLGSVKADGVTAFWKIDYFDKNLTWHSPAKDNPKVTERVLTVMLPEEY